MKNSPYVYIILMVFGIFVGLSGRCQQKLSSYSGNWVQSHTLFQYVDPLEKVFPGDKLFADREALRNAVRGGHANFQYVFRCNEPVDNLNIEVSTPAMEGKQLGKPSAGFIGFVHAGRETPLPAPRDQLTPESSFYPDPILPADPKEVPPNFSQPIWVNIPIPENVEPGTYKGTVSISGNTDTTKISMEKEFSIKVYEPIVKESSLWVTNWFSLNNWQYMNGGESVEKYSETYWNYTRKLANMMDKYRQNVALLSPLRLAEYTVKEGPEYSIDFSNFNKAVDIFMEAGVLGKIEGGHIGTRESNWSSPFVVIVPVQKSDTLELEKFSISNDTAKVFYRQFFSELMQNLETKGWKDIYIQHLADEPIASNKDSYIEIARFVKELIPDIPIIEACHTKELNNTVDIWVPQLNFFANDYEFYQKINESNDEAWFYTCLGPKGNFANRFLDLPLLKTRILHWINFKYNSPGYLHWGFNQWRGEDVYQETTAINKESGNVLPGGDAWIVYPGEGKIYPSIRLEAMRNGIVDYELLKRLAEKDEAYAKELSRQIVFNFTTYEMDLDEFRDIRRRVLEHLSGKPIPDKEEWGM